MGLLYVTDGKLAFLIMKRILVVEDEQMLAQIIEIKLKEEQYEVEHAYDGQQAYEMLSRPELPDLVLMDVLMPKMSGFEVLQKLHDDKKVLPRIMIFSNFAQQSDIEKAKQLGALDYIVKAAFSPAEIISKIKGVFAAAEANPSATGGYNSFDSMQEVMPMSEVLHPGAANNNP